jgi:hypothetical protein
MKSKPFFDKMRAISPFGGWLIAEKRKYFLYVYGFVQKNMIKY